MVKLVATIGRDPGNLCRDSLKGRSEMDTTKTLDTSEILAAVPADWRPAAREYLAAIAAATSQEERDAIKGRAVDATVREARNRNWCPEAERALTFAFGEPEGGAWVDSDGIDCRGRRHLRRDADGYDADGYDANDRDREGYDRGGQDRDGYDRDGFDRRGYDRDGYGRDGFNANGFNREHVDKDGRSEFRFNLVGFDADGFNREGFNADGLNRDGFNRNGWDAAGFNTEGFDAYGYNRDGLNADGRNRYRFGPDGYDPEGYDSGGYSRDGLTRVEHARIGTSPRMSSR
jgi:hypothetical protein